MKKLIAFCFVTLLFSQVLWADDIKIYADPWCPYSCEPGSEKPGFMVEITGVIFEKAGHKLIYKTKPWARVIKGTSTGSINGAFGAFKSDAPDHIFSAEEIGVSNTPLFVKKDSSWRYKGSASLEKVALGVIRGYSYGTAVDTHVKKYPKNQKKVQFSNTLDTLVKKLQKGRIAAFPEDRVVFSWYVKQNNLSGQFKEAGVASVAENLYIAFSPKIAASKEYAKIFAKGIRKMRKNGELSKILAKYGLKDWK